MSSSWTGPPPGMIGGAAANLIERRKVEAGDGVETGEALNHGSGSEATCGCLEDRRQIFFADGGGAEGRNDGRGRADGDVGADAPGAPGGTVQGAIAHAHQGQDHRDFHRDRKHAEQSADRAVGQVSEDQLIQQDSSLTQGAPISELRRPGAGQVIFRREGGIPLGHLDIRSL